MTINEQIEALYIRMNQTTSPYRSGKLQRRIQKMIASLSDEGLAKMCAP